MASTNHDLIIATFIDTFLKYGVLALLIAAVVSLIGVKLKKRAREKRRKSYNQRAWRKD